MQTIFGDCADQIDGINFNSDQLKFFTSGYPVISEPIRIGKDSRSPLAREFFDLLAGGSVLVAPGIHCVRQYSDRQVSLTRACNPVGFPDGIGIKY